MKSFILDYNNCIQTKNFSGGLKLKEILSTKKEKLCKKRIINKLHDNMDFVDLPYQDKSKVEEIQLFGTKISRLYTDFVLIGMGGSIIGTKAIYDFLPHEKDNINIHFVDSLDARNFNNLINKLDLKKTMFNFVTRSGKTVEVLTYFAIILNKLKEKLKDDFFVNIIVTTEKDNNLYKFCEKNRIRTLEIPKKTNGSYGVLTNIGLFPLAVMGRDISKILLGAKNVLENFKQEEVNKSPAFISANINYNFMLSGKREFVIVPYGKKMEGFAKFYLSLLSESLSKDEKLNGGANNIFLSPSLALGISSQHCLLQMYQEGAKDKVFMFLNTDKYIFDVKVTKTKDNILDSMLPKSLQGLLKTECLATQMALKDAGQPSYVLTTKELDEQTAGALLFYFELVSSIMAEMMDVNGYNQKGAEKEKSYTRELIENPNKFDKQLEDTHKVEI